MKDEDSMLMLEGDKVEITKENDTEKLIGVVTIATKNVVYLLLEAETEEDCDRIIKIQASESLFGVVHLVLLHRPGASPDIE